MGYKAYILLSLVDIPNYLKTLEYYDMLKILKEEYFPKFKDTINELSSNRYELYSLIGPVTYIGSGGAGEIIYNFNKEIVLFTTKYPDFTFGVYFFYHDLLELNYWSVKNNEIIENTNFSVVENNSFGKQFKHIGLYFNIAMHTDIVEIPNNITEFINSEYENPYDVTLDFGNE